jgi:hypothetical protein
MNIYTASKFENAAFVRSFNNLVRDLGHTVTWDWTATREFLGDGTVAKITPEQRIEYGMLDYAGVMACDLLIMIDYEIPLRGGAWEAGMAVGAGKQVWIVNYQNRVIFDVLPQVRLVSDPNIALSLLDDRGTLA